MTAGYFRQLAEQALYVAPRLRPAATIFKPPQPAWGFEEQLDPTTRDSGSAAMTASATQTQAQPLHELRAIAEAPAAAPAIPIGVQPQSAERRQQAPRDARPSTPHSTREDDEPRSVRERSSPMRPPLHSPVPVAAHATAPDPAEASPSSPRPRGLQPTPPSLQAMPIAAARAAPSHARPDRLVCGARGDNDAAPEVHIHIGRIELSAVTPAAPSKRESAAARKPMSLDDYLQRRKRTR